MRSDILGVGFDALSMAEAVARAKALMHERRGAYVCTPNPEIVWACREDADLSAAVNGADMVLADGVGIVWAARRLGERIAERVTGADFAQELLAAMAGTVFLLGAKPQVAERASQAIARRFGGVRVVGVSDGYYTDEAALMAQIEAARPDFLLVCLGTPKQELFMQRHAGAEYIGLMAGLGGTLDLLAGDVRRAPDFFLRHKLEWLYRLGQQPRRIKRQLRLPLFALAVWKQRTRHGKGKTHRS